MEIINICRIPPQQTDWELLLLADEDKTHVEQYRLRSEAFVLEMDDALAAQALVTDEGTQCELQNMAVSPEYQRLGLGKMLLSWVTDQYRGRFKTMVVGTSPGNVAFYQACGFTVDYWDKDYFVRNCSVEIYENGQRLRDRCVLHKAL